MDRIQQVATELFTSAQLVDSSGGRAPSLRDSGVKVAALYFSAHWCPPCRKFTPLLKAAFQEYLADKVTKNLTSVVFVSGDRSVSEMHSYMREAHGSWPGVEPGSHLQESLNTVFQVRGIPSLIVIDDSGEVLCREGRQEVMSLGSRAFRSWNSSYVDLDTSVVDMLRDNPAEVTKDAAEILVKLLANVIRDPQSMKFRQVRLANPKIESKLLAANGAFEILFTVGFEEGTDTLILPFDANMNLIKAFKEAIEDVLEPKSGDGAASGGLLQVSAGSQGSSQSEDSFLKSLLGEHELCMSYEDPETKAAAVSAMPVEKLRKRAEERLRKLKSDDPKITDLHLDDLLVVELLDWFKKEFFTWLDDAKCDVCPDQALAFSRGDSPNDAERADGAGNTEVFVCKSCSRETRLPRYHNRPRKLLEWRRGRCGEWANCFALLLRALGYDARRVRDWSDHVWCEFYSRAEGRWIHADPCENAMDSPLLYECGWGKKLSYCIAVSRDEVQDVTWRYSRARSDAERRETLSRRREVKEEWLTKTILGLTDRFQEEMGEPAKKALRERRLKEVVELMAPRNRELTEEEKKGRRTGSLTWRLARGEAGGESPSGMSFALTETEKEAKTFHLEYDVVVDEYVRVSDGGSVVAGWQNGAKECENVARKEELDWKMAYLARTEGAAKASVGWCLDLAGTGLSVKHVELLVNSKTYESGRVTWQLCGGNQCLLPMAGVTLKTEQMNGSKQLHLAAVLTGGSGDVAWQQTQLFRAETKGKGGPQLKLLVKLQPDK